MKKIIFLFILSINIFSYEYLEFSLSGYYKETPKGYYYYNPEEVGAQAFFKPYQIIVEGGFGALYNRNIGDFNWSSGFSKVNHSILHPFSVASDYGWKKLFYYEFIPHIGEHQNYIANWVWHFTALGMRSKLLEEYYRYHGYEHSQILAVTTIYTLHYINELIQAEKFTDERASVDALPDLFFFDWAGIIFFSFKPVNEVMTNIFHLKEWSYQTMINPATHRLINNGQLFWSRLHLYKALSISTLSGEQINSINLTFEFGNKHQLSFGVGGKVKAFLAGATGDTLTSGFVYDVGIYYSINDNPVLTITYEPEDKSMAEAEEKYDNEYVQKILINLYPGLIDINGFKPGITLSIQKNAFFIGISNTNWPVGFIFSTPQDKKYLNAY